MSIGLQQIRSSISRVFAFFLAASLIAISPCGVHAGDNPVLVRTTSWGFPADLYLRGIAYDGVYYYLASFADATNKDQPPSFTGRIYLYNEKGFVKRLPEVPPVLDRGFGHGVATDGTRVWTTDPGWDYIGHIYEYDIASGSLLRIIALPFSTPTPVGRLDFDTATQTFWFVAGLDGYIVYQLDRDGKIVSSFPTDLSSGTVNVALDGRRGLWLAGARGDNASFLRRYSFEGKLLEEFSGFRTGWWGMATNIHDRAAGFIQDASALPNPITGLLEQRIEHYKLSSSSEASFSLFNPKAELKFGFTNGNDNFEYSAIFVVDTTTGNGIDPSTENVSFKLGPFSLSIPSGSFQPDGKGGFTFAGSINQVSLQAGILPSSLQARGQPTPMWATDPSYRFFVNGTGANLDGTTVPETATLSIGDDFGQGTLGVGKAVLATVGDCSSSLRGVALCVSSSSNRSNPITLDGATLNGLVYVFTQPSSGVKQVKFWFGNDPTLPPTKLEKAAPFDFAGTVANGTAYPFDTSKLSKGLHAISAQVTMGDGTVQDIVKGTFTVK